MRQPTVEALQAIFVEHSHILNLPKVDQIAVAPIGQGEANLNLLVTVNGKRPFNLRIGLRGAESEQTLQAELNALQAAEPGIGPRVLDHFGVCEIG